MPFLVMAPLDEQPCSHLAKVYVLLRSTTDAHLNSSLRKITENMIKTRKFISYRLFGLGTGQIVEILHALRTNFNGKHLPKTTLLKLF